jgi:hypothetical protein
LYICLWKAKPEEEKEAEKKLPFLGVQKFDLKGIIHAWFSINL